MSGFAAVSAAQSEAASSLVPDTEKTSRGRASPTKVRCSAAMASPTGSKAFAALLLFLSEPERAEALPSSPGSGGRGSSGSGANGDGEEPFAAAAAVAATPLATELKKWKAPENGLTESGLCTMMR